MTDYLNLIMNLFTIKAENKIKNAEEIRNIELCGVGLPLAPIIPGIPDIDFCNTQQAEIPHVQF